MRRRGQHGRAVLPRLREDAQRRRHLTVRERAGWHEGGDSGGGPGVK
jgi:hypothetical protein